MTRRLWLFGWLLALLLTAARAQPLQPVPALSAQVIDQTQTLSSEQLQTLTQKLADFEQRKGSQVVLLMVPTTAPEDIAAYANRVGNVWKLGRQGVGDGVLIVVAKDDRSMRIEVTKTLEGAIPDVTAARIINERMTPAFQRGDFGGGLTAATDAVIALIDGEPLPEVDLTPRRLGITEDPLLSIMAILLGGGGLAVPVAALCAQIPQRWGLARWLVFPALFGAVNATVCFDYVSNASELLAALVGAMSALVAGYFLRLSSRMPARGR